MNRINKQNRNRLAAVRGKGLRGLGEKGERIKQKTNKKNSKPKIKNKISSLTEHCGYYQREREV